MRTAYEAIRSTRGDGVPGFLLPAVAAVFGFYYLTPALGLT